MPDYVLVACVFSWFVATFLDLHSTFRSPSLVAHEQNGLLSFLHSKISWASIPVQVSIELCILGAVATFTYDPLQTFGLACACASVLHAWGWRHNEKFRIIYNNTYELK